jgi:alpha-amylase/alpha-mannosidase (GH57 family)
MPDFQGRYLFPWVRLHGLRDYYSMAALVERHANVHLAINLTPVLLRQIQNYVEGGFTDRALDLTQTPTHALSSEDREEIAKKVFDADCITKSTLTRATKNCSINADTSSH